VISQMFSLSSLMLRLVEEAKNFNEIEEKIVKMAFELGRWMLQAVLAYLDWRLSRGREKGLRSMGVRERNVLTRLGVIKVKRRYYRDGEGNTRFLLDEAMGWGKGGTAATPCMEAQALKMCSEVSYRRSAENLSFFLLEGVSHSFLHRLVQELGRERRRQKRDLAEDLFSRGALPPSERREAERLFMEVDGCFVSLQRERRKKHELKAAISYEGWRRVGEDRWATRGKRAFLSAADGESFLREWSADLATVYDHSNVKEVIWSSDGAFWLRRGPGLFSCTHAQLDRFHLKRSLARALGFSDEASRLFSLACCGRAEEVIRDLEEHLKRATEEGKKKRISEAIAYISSLSSWLCDWRKVLPEREEDRSPGAMESNVDKLLADRFKKRGMSWRIEGADHLCQVIELKENGELLPFLASRRGESARAEKGAMASLRKEVRRDPEAWLKKNMPLLQTRSGDPWVKDVLMGLAGYERIAC